MIILSGGLIKTKSLSSFLVAGNSTSCIVTAVTKRGCKDKPCVKKLEKALDTVS